MLELQYILENLEQVRTNTEQRGLDVDLDQLVALAEQRRGQIHEVETLKQRRNEVARQMKGKLPPEERQPLIEEGRQLKDQVSGLETTLRETEQQLRELQMQIPNITHPDAPVGTSEEDNRQVALWGEATQFAFAPSDHVEVAEKLELIDWESGAKVAGSKFYFLRNELVWLELALVHYALSVLQEEGFALYTTPDLARREILEGTGYNPRGEETQIYSIEGMDLSLIATAEITLGGMLQDTILEAQDLPLLMGGVSHCFRTEAGAPGRTSRGLYRVHQFTKVEMFAFTAPEQSDAMLERFRDIEERIFQGLGIPYRVVDCCTGDLGGPAYRKYDIEAWMPGREEGGAYGEVTSASNCTDYQSRRLKIRYRPEGERRPALVHTLNGTALAVSRALVVILENYQQEDGSVIIPEALRPLVGKDRIG